MDTNFRSGFVALVGRPNVGKSTLVNTILGTKVSIVTPKAQTTRNRIHAIYNGPDVQIVFVDTPGWTAPKDALRKALRSIAGTAASDADATLIVVEPSRGQAKVSEDDGTVVDIALSGTGKAVVALNKIDTLAKKEELLPWIAQFSERTGAKVVPVSALKGDGVDVLLEEIKALLPEGPPLFPTDLHTDQAERFLVGELVREQLLLRLREEVPHSAHVVIETFDDGRDDDGENPEALVRLEGRIYVERESQKGIVVGKGGQTIKLISTKAREQIERVLGAKVFLRLSVAVDSDWTRNRRSVASFGFDDPGSSGGGYS